MEEAKRRCQRIAGKFVLLSRDENMERPSNRDGKLTYNKRVQEETRRRMEGRDDQVQPETNYERFLEASHAWNLHFLIIIIIINI